MPHCIRQDCDGQLDYLKRLKRKFSVSSLEEKAVLGKRPQKPVSGSEDLAHVTSFVAYRKLFETVVRLMVRNPNGDARKLRVLDVSLTVRWPGTRGNFAGIEVILE